MSTIRSTLFFKLNKGFIVCNKRCIFSIFTGLIFLMLYGYQNLINTIHPSLIKRHKLISARIKDNKNSIDVGEFITSTVKYGALKIDQHKRCKIGQFNDFEDPRFASIIQEEEALQHAPCYDTKLAASTYYSEVALLDTTKTSYEQGEIILAKVTMYDGYGNMKTTGGDLLRATIHDIEYNKHAAGVVIDNLDGTYTVEIKTFWSGTSIIKVILSYTREAITAIYRVRMEVLATRNIYAKFESYNASEEVICHPDHVRLLEATNTVGLCNMTDINTGMSFYCERPKHQNLTCDDWKFVSSKTPYPSLSYTECESTLLKSSNINLTDTVTVDVKPELNCKTSPLIPVSEYNITQTWTSREPTGYFIERKWNFAQIIGIDSSSIQDCIRNKRIYLIGDSTLRHWFTFIMRQTKCVKITGTWTKQSWHQASECVLKEIDFKIGWYPHSQPFCVGGDWESAEHTSISIARRIDDIPNDENAIVVFQIFMHHLTFHHSVAQDRYEHIRNSVERLLMRNRNAVVLIKGPHTFTESKAVGRINDCYVGLFNKIIYDSFKGLYDRVVLLNNQDPTIATHNDKIHPPLNIVSAMVEQMFYFACRK